MGGVKSYVSLKSDKDWIVDGNLDKEHWRLADWTDEFLDIEGDRKPKPRHRTRAKMLWSSQGLYIGAELIEPQIWGTLTQHDSVIFHDNDFEVFLDPDGDNHLYVELEVNALNTTWDLLLIKPYRNGGPPVDGFEIAGLKTAVKIYGALNDPTKSSEKWTVEIFMPWSGLRQVAGRECPPLDGDQWRINFSRVQWQVDVINSKFVKKPGLKEDNWVWSPQGVIDMHRPEKWGILEFAESKRGPKPYPGEDARQALMDVYHAQERHRNQTGNWAKDAKELLAIHPAVKISRDASGWTAVLEGWSVNEESRLRKVQ